MAPAAMTAARVRSRPGRTLVGHAASVLAVAFSLDGALVATGSGDRTACLRDAAAGQATRILAGHGQPALAVAFSPEGTLLAAVGRGRTARLRALA